MTYPSIDHVIDFEGPLSAARIRWRSTDDVRITVVHAAKRRWPSLHIRLTPEGVTLGSGIRLDERTKGKDALQEAEQVGWGWHGIAKPLTDTALASTQVMEALIALGLVGTFEAGPEPYPGAGELLRPIWAIAVPGPVRDLIKGLGMSEGLRVKLAVEQNPKHQRWLRNARRFPCLVPFIPTDLDAAGEAALEDFAQLEFRNWRFPVRPRSVDFLGILRGIPKEDWPQSREDFTAFAELAVLSWIAAGKDVEQAARLLQPVAGSWNAAIWKIIAAAFSAKPVHHEFDDLAKLCELPIVMVDAFCTEVLEPIVLHLGLRTPFSFAKDVYRQASWTTLFGSAGIAPVMEGTLDWGGFRGSSSEEGLLRALHRLAERYLREPPRSWIPLFLPWNKGNLQIECMENHDRLKQEEKAMRQGGISQIVSLAWGTCQVASIFQRSAGSERRLSSVAFVSVDGDELRVAWHRGVNGEPPPDAARAFLTAFLAETKQGREALKASMPMDLVRKYRAWAPFIAHRTPSIDALAESPAVRRLRRSLATRSNVA